MRFPYQSELLGQTSLRDYYQADDVYGETGVNVPLFDKLYGEIARSFMFRIIDKWGGLYRGNKGTYSDPAVTGPEHSSSANGGATGDAYKWTKALGVSTVGDVSLTYNIGNATLKTSRFWVNQKGERYIDEACLDDTLPRLSGTGTVANVWVQKLGHDTAAQKSYCYMIIDQDDYDVLNAEAKAAIEAAINTGKVTKESTIADLAEKLDIVETGLTKTITDTGKVAIDSTAYYAEQIQGFTSTTSVIAIDIDNDGRVKNASGAISGLYASGDCTFGAVFPGGYYHKGEGMGVAMYTAVNAVRTVLSDIAK